MEKEYFIAKFHYQCINCGKVYSEGSVKYLCPVCSKTNSEILPPKGVLKTIYPYSKIIGEGRGFAELKEQGFLDLLPINTFDSLPNLRIGDTPFYKIEKLNKQKLPFQLFLKDDSQNPTFSFKDRASALVSAYGKEKGWNTIVAASTGNAGSSLAGICAAQGQQAIVLVPENAPLAKLTQIIMYGAKIIPVKGTYDDAFDLSIKASEEFGWYNRNTAFNPLTIEGKKTVAFELFEQMGFSIPDRIFVPVGDGVILCGMYKGFEDLILLDIIDKMPIVVGVQSDGSNNLIRNIGKKDFYILASHTIADSISVDIPRNFNMAQDFIQKYQGEVIAVSDDEILHASSMLSRNTGLFAEPAAAASFAGMLAYQEKGLLTEGSKNVVLLTGSGLKDLNSLGQIIKMPESIEPEISELKKLFR
ncbi:MAG: threonine synthase [Bacteroidales bacterium]|nr:threonine synthase [Bacteroidales bacterium]MCF8456774.1 threonine synthase [Bacteroidales bacterium]